MKWVEVARPSTEKTQTRDDFQARVAQAWASVDRGCLPSKPRKQPFRRPVDRASWAVAKRGTLELWTQLDEQLAREDLKAARR